MKIDMLKKIRTEAINERIETLNKDHIKNFFLESGFFPESSFVPGDFFTSILIDWEAVSAIKKYNTPVNIKYPKSKLSVREISTPAAKPYMNFVNHIAENWDSTYKQHLKVHESSNIISYSSPLFYQNAKRSEVGIMNYKIMMEQDFKIIKQNYSYCLFVDINNFYPSLYTHSLSWILDPKTNHENKCVDCDFRCTSCENRCTNCTEDVCTKDLKDKCTRKICCHKRKCYYCNVFDSKISKTNRNRTKGILIGPYSSDFVSELFLQKLDLEFSDKIDCEIGLRFKDDYVLFFNSPEDAQKSLKEIQSILETYHLNINENKTKITEILLLEDNKSWKTDIESIKDIIKECTEKITNDAGDEFKKLSLSNKKIKYIIKKTAELYTINNDPYIIKSVLGSFIYEIESINIFSTFKQEKYPHEISKEEMYNSILSELAHFCDQVPSAWSSFYGIFVLLGSEEQELKMFKEYLRFSIEKHYNDKNNFALIWSLWATRKMEIDLNEVMSNSLQDTIKTEYSTDWLLLNFFSLVDSSLKTPFESEDFLEKKVSDIISVFSYSSKDVDVDVDITTDVNGV